LLYKTEAKRLKEYERTVAQEAERAFVTTRNDMAAIGGNNVTVLPNGVQEAYLNRHQSVDCVRGRIVFLGRMDYYPNVDAVRYFADEVFPQIRDNMGAASFMIVGSNPSEEVLTLGARDGINVTGFVDEPAEYLESATVVVAPMRYGTGIQNKVLEAMALGKPVVTTPLGATGIDAEHGTHLFVADGETAMYKWTMKVLTEPKLAADVGEAAHKKILNCYTWDAVAPTLLNGISDIVE
jgi:glycosyltransferase involved in cell wall biosynthesis